MILLLVLLMIDILLCYITNCKFFYWFGWFMVVIYLSILAFVIGSFFSVYINLF